MVVNWGALLMIVWLAAGGGGGGGGGGGLQQFIDKKANTNQSMGWDTVVQYVDSDDTNKLLSNIFWYQDKSHHHLSQGIHFWQEPYI